jgi:integrase
VIVTPDDLGRMFAACDSWQEFLCLSVLAYVGARRDAASRLRWRDVDLSFGNVRLHETGGKVVDVTIPDELAQILREACESGGVRCGPDDYVIPNRRPVSVKRVERSNKVIWETVVKIARRAGVRSTVHALRRAFAVAFLSSNPGAIEALKELLNHSRIDTTQIYLKALNRSQLMEPVRDLSWTAPSRFPSQTSEGAWIQGKAHTGFEPVPPP